MTNKTLFLFVAAMLVILAVFASYNYKHSKELAADKPSEQIWDEQIWDDSWDKNKPDLPKAPEKQPIEKKKGSVVASYERAVELSAKEGIPVLLIFGNNHCKYCKTMEKEVYPNKQVKDMLDNYIVCKINTGSRKNAQVAKKFGVEYVPAFVITNSKEEKLKFEQKSMNSESFSKWLDNPSIYDQFKEGNKKDSAKQDDDRSTEEEPSGRSRTRIEQE